MIPRVHPDFRRERISPHFVYESYDEKSGLFFNRGSVGFVLEGWPLVGTEMTAQGEMAEFLKDSDSVPEGASFQVLMLGSQNVKSYLDTWKEARKGDIFQELAQKRSSFLAEKAQKEGTIKDMTCLFALTIPASKVDEDLVYLMEKRRDILQGTLNAIGMGSWTVSAQRLLGHLRPWFLGGDDQADYNPLMLLSEQIVPNDLTADVLPDKIEFTRPHTPTSHISCLEVTKRPPSWELPFMDLFIGNEMRRGEQILSDFMLSFALTILPKQGKEKIKAFSKREACMKNKKSGMGKLMGNLDAEYEDLDAANKAIQLGDRVVHLIQSIALKDDPALLKERAYSYASQMRRSGFHFTPCENDHLGMLLGMMPMHLVEEKKGLIRAKVGGIGPDLASLGRGIKTVSSEAKALLPIVGEWKGDLRSPGMILRGRRGQIMYWSPFGPVLIPREGIQPQSNENFNLCIAGVPGSGKSVFMQELMLTVLGIGGKVFVLDYGRSFKRTCQILQGTYIEFDLKEPISLNPFSEVSEEEKDFEAREDALSGISSVLSTMAAPLQGTSDLQNAVLQKALRQTWNKLRQKAEITDIADFLLEQEEEYAKDLGNMLFPFTKEGIYGAFFKGKAGVKLNAQIVVIETDHLRNVPALLSVVVQMMIVQINQSMVKGDRKYPFLIMIDEAWKLLQGKSSGAFIEEMGRIARKYKGSITLATQQLTDYFRQESPAAEKAFENASWKAILKQNPESLLAMRSNPKLASFVKDDFHLNFMQSIHSAPPHYSEAALFGPDVKGVIGRLMLDPFTLLLTSTNAEDYQALEERTKRGMSIAEAVNDVLEQRSN